MHVAGLSTPITFTLPPSPALGPATAAQCVFYDDASGQYSTAGCASLPNPLPHGLAAYWLPNATVSGPAALAETWALRDDGSGVGAALLAGCGTVFLNCSDPASLNVSIFPDPQRPLSVPSVNCGGALSGRVLRVYNGTRCGLIANASCYWNQTAQAFNGTGCAVANVTSCACVHLTDFASQGAPKISVCSAKDLTAVSPGDIITKLKFFLVLICTLFGAMHLIAALAAAVDARDLRRALASVKDERCGFRRAGPDGAWTWELRQEPLKSQLSVVQSYVGGARAPAAPAGDARTHLTARTRRRRLAGGAVRRGGAPVRARSRRAAGGPGARAPGVGQRPRGRPHCKVAENDGRGGQGGAEVDG